MCVMLVAHMWFDLEVQVALGPHLADVSVMVHSTTCQNVNITGSI